MDTQQIIAEAVIANKLFKSRKDTSGVSICAVNRQPVFYVTPSTIVYQLDIPMSVKGDALIALQDDLLAYIRQFRRRNGLMQRDDGGMEIDPTVRIDRFDQSIEVRRPKHDTLHYGHVQWSHAPSTALVGLRYSLNEQQPVMWSPGRDDQPHVLVAGITGSGKSNLVLSMLVSLALYNSPDKMQFTIIDPKRTEELLALRAIPHTRLVAQELDDANSALMAFHREMDDRERGLVDKSVRHILIVEECASLTEHSDKAVRENALFILADIARRCRSANMNLVVCTQKPTADVLGNQLKSNLALRLVGSVMSPQDANTAVNMKQSGAEQLPGYGAFIYRLNRTLFRFQAPLIDTPTPFIQRIVSKWGQAAPLAPVQKGNDVLSVFGERNDEKAVRTGVAPVLHQQSAPLAPATGASFPLDDKRPLTAAEADVVRQLSATMSKNQLCLHVYGSKSPRYYAWIDDALTQRPQDEKIIKLRKVIG